LSSAYLGALGHSLDILAIVVDSLAYPGWRRQAINSNDEPVLPEFPGRALLSTSRSGSMKLNVVEWKVEHSKEIEWCTQLSHHVRNLDEKCKQQWIEKTFQERRGLWPCVRQLIQKPNLTSHFDGELENSLERNASFKSSLNPNQYREE
jgi:hypothetical protein